MNTSITICHLVTLSMQVHRSNTMESWCRIPHLAISLCANTLRLPCGEIFLDVCLSCHATWRVIRSIPSHTAAGLKPAGVWLGKRGCRKKMVQESKTRGAATLQRRLEAAASKMGVQEQWTWWTRAFEYRYRTIVVVSDIVHDIECNMTTIS